MSKTKSVSCCIVTYNNGDKIKNTIQSVFELTKGVELSFFVVDNCSSDNTVQIIKENFPSVTVIERRTNDGFGAGHNAVLPFLKSDFHAVINPDIELKSNALYDLAEYASKDESIGLLSPKIVFADGSTQLLGKKNPSFRYLLGHRLMKKGDEVSKLMAEYCMVSDEENIVEITNATGCFMFFKTEVFEKLGGFDERFFMYLEDCDIARRAAEISKVLYYPKVEIVHLWERGSKKSKKLLAIHVQSILKYFLKWGVKF